MGKFREKPVIIEVIQFNGSNGLDIFEKTYEKLEN